VQCTDDDVVVGRVVLVSLFNDDSDYGDVARRCQDTSDPRHFGPKTFRM